jgi:imidazolonepropionase-like amidohydrolase
MTPVEAIATATRTAAQVLGTDAQVGTLEPGKYADVIAVAGNPLKDIRVLQDRKRIRLVMKGGDVCVDRRAGHEKRVILDAAWQAKLDALLAPSTAPALR